MKYPFFSWMLLLAASLTANAAAWRFDDRGSGGGTVAPDADGSVSARVAFPGSAQLYLEPERATFRPKPEDFQFGELELEAKIEIDAPGDTRPVRGNVFIKDKDGFWFQSAREIEIHPGEYRKYAIPIDRPGADWIAVGHQALWHAGYAAGIFNAGISVYGQDAREFRLRCRNLRLGGSRRVPELAVVDWQLPRQGVRFAQLESSFQLSREYFNPFDPEEIKVDFEFRAPDGGSGVYPAFFTQDFYRQQELTREVNRPVGAPYWKFRFLPVQTGRHEIRLLVSDRSGAKITTPWRAVEIRDEGRRGPIRVSPKNRDYFEYSDGSFFYPVGLNIHTNTDLRSEFRFDFGHLPDLGTFDYDTYLAACGRNGINTVEIWMASWTYALEWDAAREFYHGLGRYNLANAWRLDRVLDTANANGILVNLVLDNHGKASMNTDQEWNDNPLNAKAAFAVANGGFLADAKDFFTDPGVRKYNTQRNRYIAARWGANPGIFAVELWSEVDLVSGFRERYADGQAIKWHADAAAEYSAQSQANHLITTHVCGDWRNSQRYRSLFEIPEFTHWAGDAYRSDRVHIVDQMREQNKNLRTWKPTLITEYGGASIGGDRRKILADVHGGLWSSFFTRQPGTPFLWWHDFVHQFKHYQHYAGFAAFAAGTDLRDGFEAFEPVLTRFEAGRRLFTPQKIEPRDLIGFTPFPFRDHTFRPLLPAWPNHHYEALAVGNGENVCGWIFNRQAMYVYPDSPLEYPEARNLGVVIPRGLAPGQYRLRFYDTMSGRVVFAAELRHSGGELQLPVVPFRLDCAFKLEKVQ